MRLSTRDVDVTKIGSPHSPEEYYPNGFRLVYKPAVKPTDFQSVLLRVACYVRKRYTFIPEAKYDENIPQRRIYAI